MKKLIPFIIVLLGVVGCHSVTPPQPYVTADRKTKVAVENYLKITGSDRPDLQPGIDDLLESWELRVKSAEQGVWPK